MTFPLSRRDLFKTMAVGALAALPANSVQARRKHHGPEGAVSGKLTGAEAVVETLLQEGTACVFGIPGAQENELWDAMKSRHLPYLLVTHEFSAATMADGYARSTGKPGVLCTVPGPGVTNSLTGLGEALLDSIPVVTIVGDVARGEKYHAFQVHEMPTVALLQQVTKGTFEVKCVGDIPVAIRQAFSLARSGEPGPTAVVIPYNLLLESHKFEVSPFADPALPFDEAGAQCALQVLANRKLKVGIYAGLGCMDYSETLTRLAELLQAPVATSICGKGVISETHPLSVGWGYGPQATATAEKIFKHDVDVVLAIGVRYSEVSTGFYSIPQKWRLLHVDINPNNLGRNMKAEVCVNADAGLFMEFLLSNAPLIERPCDGKLHARIKQLKHEELKKNLEVYAKCGTDPMAFILALRRCANEDAMLFVDVTVSQYWATEAFTVCRPRTFFNPTDNQAMGWSIPASIGAQRVHHGRQTLTITGDGCFLMSAMEISTAGREALPVKFFVLDDQAYHYMQALQKPAYLRTTATILARLDYAALAQGFGVGYQEIHGTSDLDAGIRRALCQDGPVLIRVITDYSKRPIRWLDAARDRFVDELSPHQKMRFLARIGSRALDFKAEHND